MSFRLATPPGGSQPPSGSQGPPSKSPPRLLDEEMRQQLAEQPSGRSSKTSGSITPSELYRRQQERKTPQRGSPPPLLPKDVIRRASVGDVSGPVRGSPPPLLPKDVIVNSEGRERSSAPRNGADYFGLSVQDSGSAPRAPASGGSFRDSASPPKAAVRGPPVSAPKHGGPPPPRVGPSPPRSTSARERAAAPGSTGGRERAAAPAPQVPHVPAAARDPSPLNPGARTAALPPPKSRAGASPPKMQDNRAAGSTILVNEDDVVARQKLAEVRVLLWLTSSKKLKFSCLVNSRGV